MKAKQPDLLEPLADATLSLVFSKSLVGVDDSHLKTLDKSAKNGICGQTNVPWPSSVPSEPSLPDSLERPLARSLPRCREVAGLESLAEQA